jgi:hypothetical protein
MTKIIAFVALFCLTACVSMRPGNIRVENDEFTKRTTVHLDGMKLLFNAYSHVTGGPTNLDLSLFRIVHPDRSPVMLVFSSWSDNWVYLYCHDLYLLIDDVSVPVKTKRAPGRVQGRYVYEYITAEMPLRA